MRFIKRLSLILFALILNLTVISCSSANIKPTVTNDETIKIGVLLPLSGLAKPTGIKLKAAVDVAEELINGAYPNVNIDLGTAAGLPNLNNKKVKFIYADHKANPETARAEAERLIKEEKVVAMIGAYHSSATKTASQVAEEHKIPFLAGSSSSASLTTRGYKYFFRIAPDDYMETESFFEYIKYLNQALNAGIKSIGVVYIDNEYGIHANEMVDKWLEKKYREEGFEKSVEIRYQENLENIDEGIKKLKEVNPDAIFQASYIEDVTKLVRNYKIEKILPKAVISYCGGFHDPLFVDNLGEDGNYYSGSTASMPKIFHNNESEYIINQLYKQKTGEDLDGPALEEFASAIIMADAINTAASTNGDDIRHVLSTKEFSTPYFTSYSIKFDENGQNIKDISFMVQIQKGKYEVVWPLNVQERLPELLK